MADAGADAVEVGIPFSDPVMDGPVIQEASRRALERGARVSDILRLVAEASLSVPVVVMTYLNPILSLGEAEFLSRAASCGVAGVIVPDLPVDEAGDWIERCAGAGIAPVLLAAPNSSPKRLGAIAEASRGFVYCVSTFGVTGSRSELSGSARDVVSALRPLTDLPLLVGVGISTPEQAAEACGFADGVVVGSALVSPVLRGDPDEALRLATAFRTACR
jgi:tryptophan synthase alpha chain